MLPASIFSVVFTLSVLRHGQESKLPSLFDFFIYFHFSKNCCCLCRTRKIDGKTRRKRSSLVRNVYIWWKVSYFCYRNWLPTPEFDLVRSSRNVLDNMISLTSVCLRCHDVLDVWCLRGSEVVLAFIRRADGTDIRQLLPTLRSFKCSGLFTEEE